MIIHYDGRAARITHGNGKVTVGYASDPNNFLETIAVDEDIFLDHVVWLMEHLKLSQRYRREREALEARRMASQASEKSKG